VVALTLTPALCAYVLPRRAAAAAHGDAFLVRTLKRGYRPVLRSARCGARRS
jgi:Cu/Ag efflux pump CusA